MTKSVLIVNTHPGPNPDFIRPLKIWLSELGLIFDVVSGYAERKPDHDLHSACILTGVPLSVPYSLAQSAVQQEISQHFQWLKSWPHPALGICYGHQILGFIFGGTVSSLPEKVINPDLQLDLHPDKVPALSSSLSTIPVFAEHGDYISSLPKNFLQLARREGIPYLIFDPRRRFTGLQFVPEQSPQPTRDVFGQMLLSQIQA